MPNSLQGLSSTNTLDHLFTIAKAVVTQTDDKKDLSGIIIRSFEDQRRCVVQRKETNWFFRVIEAIGAFFSRKKIVPYSLKDNLSYLKQLLDKSAPSQTIEIQQEIVILQTIRKFSLRFHEIVDKTVPKRLVPLVESIDKKVNELCRGLQKDINSKKSAEKKPKIPTIHPEIALMKEFEAKMKVAASAFSLRGTALDYAIDDLRAYQTENKGRQALIDGFRGALQQYRAIEAQGAHLAHTIDINPQAMSVSELKQVYEDSEKIRYKLVQLLMVVQEKLTKVATHTHFPQEVEALERAYQSLIGNVQEKCARAEKVEKEVRLKLYENKELTHFDTLHDHINKATSFHELNGWLDLVRSEALLIQQNKFPRQVVDKSRQKIEACVFALAHAAVRVSAQTRETLSASLLAMKTKSPSEEELVKQWVLLKEYEAAVPHLEQWLKTSLDEEVKSSLSQELTKAQAVIKQANTLLEGRFQKLKEKAKDDVAHQAAQYSVTGPIKADTGGVAVGMMHGGTVTINNYYNDANRDLMQRMTSSIKTAAELGLLNFSDISSLVGIGQGVSSGLLTALKLSQATFYLIPIMNSFINFGYSIPHTLAFVGVGVFVVPYALRSLVPKHYHKYMQPLTMGAQLLYFSYVPGLMRKVQDITKQLHKPPLPIQPFSAKQTPAEIVQKADRIAGKPLQPAPRKQEPVAATTSKQQPFSTKQTPPDLLKEADQAADNVSPKRKGMVDTAVVVSDTMLESIYWFFGIGRKEKVR